MANGHGGARPGAGRPIGAVGEAKRKMQATAQKYGAEAIDLLVKIMKDKTEAPKVRMDAANAILDRAFGRPKQEADITSDGESIKPTVIKLIGLPGVSEDED